MNLLTSLSNNNKSLIANPWLDETKDCISHISVPFYKSEFTQIEKALASTKEDEEIAKSRELKTKWKVDFVKQMLENDKLHVHMNPEHIDKIVTENAQMIFKIVATLKSNSEATIEEIEKFPGTNIQVFKIKSIQEVIFKIPTKKTYESDRLFKRFDYSRDTQKEFQFTSLLLPTCCYYNRLDGKTVKLIAEEFLPISKNSYEEQKELYEYCHENTIFLSKWIEDLTRFICKTGFSDVHFDNIPLTIFGIGLVDLEHHLDPETGLKKLVRLFPKQFEIIKTLVEKEFPKIFMMCDFEQWKE